MRMHRAPNFELLPDDRWQPQLVEVALHARFMLERVWDDETAYQGITLMPNDVASRGQCGVSSLWLARYLDRHGATVNFAEGTLHLDGETYGHVWTEARRSGIGAQVLDLASDQYQSLNGNRIHIGMYGQHGDSVGLYDNQTLFHPNAVPRRKLLARYALLEQKIAKLPRRHRLPE